jgi:hypothetical protein
VRYRSPPSTSSSEQPVKASKLAGASTTGDILSVAIHKWPKSQDKYSELKATPGYSKKNIEKIEFS